MVLSATEQANVIFYLGWPGKTLVTGSTHYDSTIANRLINLDVDTESNARSLLTQIGDVRTKYTASTSRMLVRKVGDIELNSGEHEALGKEYRRLLLDLAYLLDIPLLSKGRNLSVRV